MNYRHGFHAGNHADVLKHVVLLELIAALQRKEGGLCLIDTHGGRGRYELRGEQALRTGEAASGIGRLRDAHGCPAPVSRYLKLLDRHDPSQQSYPGSPLLMALSARAQDRVVACELQTEEAEALRTHLAAHACASVHERDGYEALPALLPPKERRGLVLIDPPYEQQAAEFETVRASLLRALERWPTGVFALWYPIKQRSSLRSPLRRLTQLPAKQILNLELLVRPDDSPLRLNGSGMLIFNPPWQIEQALDPALRWLAKALGEHEPAAGWQWLKREDTA